MKIRKGTVRNSPFLIGMDANESDTGNNPYSLPDPVTA